MEFREGRVTSSYGRTTAAASVRPAALRHSHRRPRHSQV